MSTQKLHRLISLAYIKNVLHLGEVVQTLLCPDRAALVTLCHMPSRQGSETGPEMWRTTKREFDANRMGIPI